MMKKKFIKLFIIILLGIIISIIILTLINNKIMPVYINYSEAEIKRVVTNVINKSITIDLTNQFDSNNLFIINTDNNTNLTIVDFDPVILNRVISSISNLVYDNLQLINKKDEMILKKYNISDSVFYIPSGIIFNSIILNNIGPKIPIKMEQISSVNPYIDTKISEYGINNSLIEVFINVSVDVRMVLPFYSKNLSIIVKVPLAVKLIQGNVPEYYQKGYGASSIYFDKVN